MKSLMKSKASGFYWLLLAGVLGVASLIYYLSWAQANYAMSGVVVLGLAGGLALNVLALFWDNDFLIISVTVFYSIGLCQLLAGSVGSFADAYQGIVMFGDPTQVGTIVSISACILAGVVATILSGFLKRAKA